MDKPMRPAARLTDHNPLSRERLGALWQIVMALLQLIIVVASVWAGSRAVANGDYNERYAFICVSGLLVAIAMRGWGRIE